MCSSIRKRISIGYRHFLIQLSKILFCAFIAFCAGFSVNSVICLLIPESLIAKAIRIVMVFVVSLIIYIVAAYIMKIEYLEDLKQKLEAKLKGRSHET